MPQLGFEAWKAPRVEYGELAQTIRLERKRPIKVGDTLKMFTGLRTPNCRSLGWAECTSVEPIELDATRSRDGRRWAAWTFQLNGRPMLYNEVWALATRDGFESISDMLAWFHSHYSLPFGKQPRAVLIKWGPVRRAPDKAGK